MKCLPLYMYTTNPVLAPLILEHWCASQQRAALKKFLFKMNQVHELRNFSGALKYDWIPLRNELGSKNIELFHNPGGERSRISSWKCKNDKRSNEEEEATQKPNTNRRRSCPSLYLLFPCHCRAKGWCPPHAIRHPSHPRCKKPIQTESTVDIG